MSDGTRATVYPVWDGSVLPLELIASLCNEYNHEIEQGQTYPETQKLTLDAFEKYWFSGVSGIMVLGPASSIEDFDVLEGSECLGSVHIRPCFPGRSSHICTANILVKSRHRNKGVGKMLASVFMDWSLRLGYEYALFPLVYSTSIGAQRILQRLGFDCLATLPGAGILKEAPFPVDAFTFGKRLNGAKQTMHESMLTNTRTSEITAQMRHAVDFENIKFYLLTGMYPDIADTRIERARIRSRSRSYYIENGILMFKRNNTIVVSDINEQNRITEEIHNKSHNGINKVQRKVSEKYFWSGIRDTIIRVIQSCPKCHRNTRTQPSLPEQEPDVVYLMPENEDDEYVPDEEDKAYKNTAYLDDPTFHLDPDQDLPSSANPSPTHLNTPLSADSNTDVKNFVSDLGTSDLGTSDFVNSDFVNSDLGLEYLN